jgi:hypothetical protein
MARALLLKEAENSVGSRFMGSAAKVHAYGVIYLILSALTSNEEYPSQWELRQAFTLWPLLPIRGKRRNITPFVAGYLVKPRVGIS